MASYAQGTTVTVAKSQGEILDLLIKHGVKQRMMYDDDNGMSAVGFAFAGLSYRISVRMPDPRAPQFTRDRYGVTYPQIEQEKRYDAEVRRRWRSLVLVIKAKLVAVSDDISSFEEEFLSYVVLGDGKTVGEASVPMLKAMARDGSIPSALPVPGNGAMALEARNA
jgi:hypothetical protein